MNSPHGPGWRGDALQLPAGEVLAGELPAQSSRLREPSFSISVKRVPV